MKHSNFNFFLSALAMTAVLMFTACSEGESYSDRLNSERDACNAYLSNCRIVNSIPADTVFEIGPQAPYYRIEPDGNVYMQVLNAGDRKNDRARTSQTIYFRFTRYNIESWFSSGIMSAYQSNELDMSTEPTYFLYKDFTLTTSSRWGYGIQLPLDYLGAECEVNLIIKSKYGMTDEISYVMPYLWHVRYFHSRI